MGTRAVITFIDDRGDKFSVYQHWDGYPEGVKKTIAAAKKYAWELPRFEAMDFAAAFIAANKKPGGGSIYVTSGPEAHGDLAYHYDVTAVGSTLHVVAHRRGASAETFDIA